MAVTPAPEPRSERWVVPLLVLLTAAFLAYGLTSTTGPSDPAAADLSAGAQEQLERIGDGGSLVEPDNLRAAMAVATALVPEGSTITDLRVAADNVQTTFLLPSARETVNTYVTTSGQVEESDPSVATRGEPSLAVAEVPLDAPQRIAERVARLGGVGVGDVSYVLLDVARPGWGAYLTTEADFDAQLNPISAQLDGSGVQGRPR